VIIAKDWGVNEINTKNYSKSKLSIKPVVLLHWEYKSSWIFKQLEIIGEKFGFKITDAIEKFQKTRWK
jgi:excinuclease ABC subunit A